MNSIGSRFANLSSSLGCRSVLIDTVSGTRITPAPVPRLNPVGLVGLMWVLWPTVAVCLHVFGFGAWAAIGLGWAAALTGGVAAFVFVATITPTCQDVREQQKRQTHVRLWDEDRAIERRLQLISDWDNDLFEERHECATLPKKAN